VISNYFGTTMAVWPSVGLLTDLLTLTLTLAPLRDRLQDGADRTALKPLRQRDRCLIDGVRGTTGLPGTTERVPRLGGLALESPGKHA
jgi:hypothetical protein